MYYILALLVGCAALAGITDIEWLNIIGVVALVTYTFTRNHYE